MPVSASPWGNLLSQQIKSPESFTADRQAVEAGGITNALNTAKLGEYQQGLQRSEQLRNMLSSGAGSDQLMKGGFLKEGMDLAKNNADVGNINAEETGRRVESFAKKAAIMRSSIGSVPTPQAAARYMQQAFADPDMGPVMKQFGTLEDALSEIPSNPNDFRNWQMQASEGIGKLVDHAEEQRTQAETERNNKAQNGIALSGQRVTMRGQDMTDSRARDFNAVQVEANNIKRSEKKDVADLTKNSQVASFDTMLGTLDRLGKHSGLSRSVGVTGAFPTMPGSDSANFQAELNTFQSQAFLPMVAQLKGMGALSDAEGKKLTAAVGALDPKMGEQAFRDSVARITADMEAARTRVAGAPRAGGASGEWGSPASKAPKAGAVDGGYRFKGGNPADKSNWEKVQ